MPNTPAEHIVWIDCEMTGLNIATDRLCEIAVIITDFSLTPVHPGLEIVINPGEEALAQMNDFVRNMHTVSGLLDRIPDGSSLTDAESEVMRYLRTHIRGQRRPLVAGNTIGMDRRFISEYMPTLDAMLHYRSIDVSTIKELSRRWYPASYGAAPEKHGGHRALADIAESIQELAYFRDTVMVNAPGIDTAAAQAAGSRSIEQYADLIAGSSTSAQPE